MSDDDITKIDQRNFKSDKNESISVHVTPEGLKTNFWELDFEAAGLLLIVPNSGLLNLLIPRCHEKLVLPKIQTARMAVLTEGVLPGPNNTSFELLLEDNTETPMVLFLDKQQVRIPDAERSAHVNQTAQMSVWQFRKPQPAHFKQLLCGFRTRLNIPTGGEPWQ